VARRLVFAGSVAVGIFSASALRAEPQGHAAWRPALCGVGESRSVWQRTRLCNGITGDLLFFRRRNRDFGFGPYLELTTAGFWDVRWGGGATLLVPVTENFPLVLSLGVVEHELRAPAWSAAAFFGARSYNFDGAYNWALGVFASAARDLAEPRATLVSAGFEIDGFFLAAPLLFAVSALR
jgi:hypothetical protein